MNKQEYIKDVLSNEWKTIEGKTPLESLKWDDDLDGFLCLVEGSNDYVLRSYEEFFDNYVLKSNPRFWQLTKEDENEQRLYAGWLCVVNAIAIFLKYKDVDLAKSSNEIGKYVKDRVEDSHYSIKNNLLPPWVQEKVGMNFILD